VPPARRISHELWVALTLFGDRPKLAIIAIANVGTHI
jgi:hypothetical protein